MNNNSKRKNLYLIRSKRGEYNLCILIGDVLKGVRKCSGLTQSEFAKEINVSQSYISKLEKNEISPNVELLDLYAKFFDVEPELFLKFRNLKDKDSLATKIRIALFKKLIYNTDNTDE